MITTRNRWADLQRTCRRLLELQPAADEVLVCADGCSDGTAAAIRAAFPAFTVFEHVESLGSVASRDRLLRTSISDIVVSLDDDSYPLDTDFVARLREVFATHPEAAVISFPELRDAGVFSEGTKSDTAPGHYVSAYANCAAAMRRDFYLRQPGFARFFQHMYEEPDYALQCYAGGGKVWFEPSLVIRHHCSATGREPMRRHHQNSRNELWSVWMRCPWPWLPLVSLFRIARQFQYACSQGAAWAIQEPAWWFQALGGIRHCLQARRPIAWPRYLWWMRLARQAMVESSHETRQLQVQSQ